MRCLTALAVGVGLLAGACTTSHDIQHNVKVEPTEHTIRVEPIKITVDINVKVQVEKELEDLFDFREDLSSDSAEKGEE